MSANVQQNVQDDTNPFDVYFALELKKIAADPSNFEAGLKKINANFTRTLPVKYRQPPNVNDMHSRAKTRRFLRVLSDKSPTKNRKKFIDDSLFELMTAAQPTSPKHRRIEKLNKSLSKADSDSTSRYYLRSTKR